MPSSESIAAWARLARVQHGLRSAIESDLKAEGFPPLAWYDVLLELSRAANGRLRPLDLEKTILLPQYSTSRLLERLVKAGLVMREACPSDRRGQVIAITTAGRALRQKMWEVYAAAIERHIGGKLSTQDAAQLCTLLGRLG